MEIVWHQIPECSPTNTIFHAISARLAEEGEKAYDKLIMYAWLQSAVPDITNLSYHANYRPGMFFPLPYSLN